MYPMFFGPPGAGKGTQAELLSRRLHIPHVSGGGLLRAVAAQGGSSAATIREQLASGEIITDSFVMDLIAARLNQPDCTGGAILDGCVRTLEQAEKLDEIMDTPLTEQQITDGARLMAKAEENRIAAMKGYMAQKAAEAGN